MSNEQQEPSMEEILASIRRIISDEPGSAPEAAPADKPEEQVMRIEPDAVDAGSFEAVMADVAKDEPSTLEAVAPDTYQPGPLDAPQPEASDGAGNIDEDIFDLTADMRVDAPAPVVSTPVEEDPFMAASTAPEPASTLASMAAELTGDDGRIMSLTTEAAAAAALAGLASAGVPKIQSSSGFEGVTVETIVRELLRPMLREWMDNNLPTLVERLVEAEIERLSRRRSID